MFLICDPNEYSGLKENIRCFLALKAMNGDKEILKTLTETDREKASQRLKDVDSAALFRVISSYRYLAKGSREWIKIFDLGIPTISEKLSLAARAKDYLEDQEVLLDKLSPKELVENMFSKHDERKSVLEIWEAFLKFPELPILKGEKVLKNTLAKEVQDGFSGF